MKAKVAGIILITAWLWAPGRAQKPPPLKLLHADRLESYQYHGQTVRRLVGHVKLSRQGFVLTCRAAEHNLDRGEVRLSGQVHLFNDTTDMRAKYAFYSLKNEMARLVGDVRYRHRNKLLRAQKILYFVHSRTAIATGTPFLQDSARSLQADTIQYEERLGLGVAWPRAVLVDSTARNLIRGQTIRFWYRQDSLVAAPQGELMKWDSTGDTLFSLAADTLMLQSELFQARGHALFQRQDSRITCGQVDYLPSQKVAYLRQQPLLRQGSYRLSGERFILHFTHEQVDRVTVPAEALFIQLKSWQDSLFQDRLRGQRMEIFLEHGQARLVKIQGMASSRFHAVEDSVYQGLNIVSGDSILIALNDSTITEVRIIGATQGKFLPSRAAELKGPVQYQAGQIIYDLQREHSALLNNARIKYQDMELSAGRIDVLWRKNLLQATPLDDSTDSGPVFTQTGQAPFKGREMVYDLRTERGKVLAGKSKYQEGHYYGHSMARINAQVYQVEQGYYTTCDLEPDPHYYFYSSHMKLLQDHWLIARPLWLYIADVPLLYLPFAILPQHHGRSSGFLIPSYDYVATHGRALKGFGYYWAPSDYFAAKFIVDFYDGERYTDTSGVLRRAPILQYRTIMNYKIRYRLSGQVRGTLTPDWQNGRRIYRWSFAFQHNQTFNPTLSINASGRLYGDAHFEQDFNSNQDTRLNKKLRSAVTLSKRWPEWKSSLTANATYDQDLQVGEKILLPPSKEGVQLQGPTLLLPHLSFSRQSSALFPASGMKLHWYNRLRWNYRSAFSNPIKVTYNSQQDSSGELVWVKHRQNDKVWTHSATLSGSYNLLGVLNASASLTGNSGIIFQYALPVTDSTGRVVVDSTGKIVTHEQRGWLGRVLGSLSVGLSTKLYGLFPLEVGPLQAIRHVVTPSLSISYSPSFAKPGWGYVRRYRDSSGNEITYDPFKNSPLGNTPARKVLNLSFKIGNEFDYKWGTGKQVQKGKLLTWSMSGNYNAAADSLRLSNISNSFRFYLGKFLNLDLRSKVDLYEHDSSGAKIDRFSRPRISSQSLNFGFKLTGHGWKPQTAQDSTADTAAVGDFGLGQSSRLSPGDVTGGELWQASFSLAYNFNHTNPFAKAAKSFWLNTVLDLRPTRSWKVRYSARFDLLKHRLVSHNLSLNRDLHCWTLQFNWQPSGRYSSWNITIRVKAPHLRDLKIKHTSRAFRL